MNCQRWADSGIIPAISGKLPKGSVRGLVLMAISPIIPLNTAMRPLHRMKG